MLTHWFHVINIFSYCCRKLRKMPGNTLKLSGKVREKSGNFILPYLLEPCTHNYIKPPTFLNAGSAVLSLERIKLKTANLLHRLAVHVLACK